MLSPMRQLPILLLAALFLGSCSQAYYGAMDKMGIHKREILLKRVKKARGSQVEAKETFASALDEFIAVTDYQGGDLERTYRRLDDAYQRANDRANEVRESNDAVANVGKALFKEWDKEIREYENPEFRADSQRQRDLSERRLDELMTTMRRAEDRLDPVLTQLRDHVLYLKHNLNARAIAALEGKASKVRIDVNRLIKDMEKSIAEADSFIRAMNAP